MLSEEIREGLKKKTAVVTGGTGMIGRAVCDLLHGAGCGVKTVSLDETPDVRADLTDFEACKFAVAGADFVFHLAGIKAGADTSRTKPASHFVPTLQMTTNVLEAARLAGVKKLVFTSSIGAYAPADVLRESEFSMATEPMDLAGWAKRMGELQIKAYGEQYGIKWAIVRPSNVYGPGDNFDPVNGMVIPSLMARIAAGENPVVVAGDGSNVRDFVYSEDVAEGIIRALWHGTEGFVNLGSGGGTTIDGLMRGLQQLMLFGYQYDPSLPSGRQKRVMDISLARKTIGYDPRTALLTGLQKTWEWYVANKDEHLKRQNYFK